MTLTSEQFNKLATKDDLKNFATKDEVQEFKNEVLAAIDGVVHKLDVIEHVFVSNPRYATGQAGGSRSV